MYAKVLRGSSPTQRTRDTVISRSCHYLTERQRLCFISIFAVAFLLVSIATWQAGSMVLTVGSLASSGGPGAAIGGLNLDDLLQVQHLDPKLIPRPSHHGEHTRRLVIIGDVHGCRDELEALLAKIRFRPSNDHLISTGDVINKGPDSSGVVDIFRSLHASAVRGNHEDNMLHALASLTSAEMLSATSEKEKQFQALARELSHEQIEWIAERPLILSLGQVPGLPYANIVVVHAGLVPGTTFEDQPSFFVMNMRAIEEEGLIPKESRHDGQKWWEVWNKAQEQLPADQRTLVVYGHDSKQGLVEKKYSIGLDSGCVKGGRLSALVIHVDGFTSPAEMKIESVECRGNALLD